ncbi:hypothetical protein PR048_006372, partial [Dryococelus australis]
MEGSLKFFTISQNDDTVIYLVTSTLSWLKENKGKLKELNLLKSGIESYPVIRVVRDMVKNFSGALAYYYKQTFRCEGYKFMMSKYKLFEFNVNHKNTMQAHTTLNTLVTDEFEMLKSHIDIISMPEAPVYVSDFPMKTKG